MSDTSNTSNAIVLPAGVTIAGKRETSQPGPNQQIQQGLAITLQLQDGTTTSLFIPYSILGNTAAVEQAIAQRVAQVQALG